MLQARSVLGIPVPKVLDYSADAANPVGSEYILMEEAKGVQLSSIWNDMEIYGQVKIVESLMEIDAKFLAVSLDRYNFPNWHLCTIEPLTTLDMEQSIMQRACQTVLLRKLEAKFRQLLKRMHDAGPAAERGFWEDERAQMSLDRGPCDYESASVTSSNPY